jgi:hypothetical protein
MKNYLIRSRILPNTYHGTLLAGPSSIAEVVADANEAITVLEWFAHLEGGEQIGLRLRGEGRNQVFNEVLSLVQGLGYSMVDAEVAEIVDRTVEGAAVGLLTCGGIGTTTKSAGITAIAALAGALAGAKVGSTIEQFGARHRYQWFPARGWVVTAVPAEARPIPAASPSVIFPA